MEILLARPRLRNARTAEFRLFRQMSSSKKLLWGKIMEIKCQRDICVREKCPASECNAQECAKVCHSFIEVSNQKEAAANLLERKYPKRKRKNQVIFDKLSLSEKNEAIRQQEAYEVEHQALETEYREKLYPFQPCDHKFEVPDEIPVGAIVICPFCKGENPISAAEKENALKKKAAAVKPEIQELLW